ncbi:MAG: hypothetical protein PHF12_05200 [Candidatus Omnitrophica bacterium]|jgi:hypothetical protein|nr:hypothetical protein [Candidatus Omnitrophota bacterium]
MSDSAIIWNLKTAIMTKFNAVDGTGAHNAFWEAIQGRLFFKKAPAETPFPYSIFFIVVHTPDRTFTEDNREILVQFSHFSDDPESSKEVDDNDTYCNDLFDEIEKRGGLSITGATLIWMRFANSTGSDWEEGETPEAGGGNWHCPTDYEVKVSMN